MKAQNRFWNILEKASIKYLLFIISYIPVLSLSLFLIDDSSGFFGHSNELTFYGTIFILLSSALILIAALIHIRFKLIARIITIIVSIAAGVLFFVISTKDFEIQLIIFFISILIFTYSFTFKSSSSDLKNDLVKSGIFQLVFTIILLLVMNQFLLYKFRWIHVYLTAHSAVILAWYIIFIKRNLNYGSKVFLAISIVIFFVYLILMIIFPYTAFLLFFFISLYLFWQSLRYLHYGSLLINLLFDKPYKLLLSSFALIILFGSILLYLDISHSGSREISFMDSFFTSTSATCVTGLIVLDTPNDFSFFGQIIILLLIQIGGLGIVTITTFVGFIFGRSIGLKGQYAVSEIIGNMRPRFVFSILRFIVVFTLIIESIGALILTISFYVIDGDFAASLWKGIFHAISAFCNAGFALQSDSLIPYRSSYIVPIVISGLIVIGGLGFGVLVSTKDLMMRKIKLRKLPLITKLTLISTLILILSGYIFFLLTEYNNQLAGMTTGSAHINALFQSVTARTAGFNTLDTGSLSNASIVGLWILMFIGAGSCSTAGGVKITTITVLISIIISYLKGRKQVVIFGREISSSVVNSTVVLLFFSIFIIIAASVLLLISQGLGIKEAIFEAISAFGTVGLSTGATMKLNSFGKFIIIVLMFTGRVGPLSFLAMLTSSKVQKVRYPEENMIIG